MISFDPFGWASRFIAAPRLHTIIRLFFITVLAGFLWLRIAEYGDYLFKPLWAMESLIFIVLIIAYGIRENPTDRSRSAAEILLPLLGSLIPFGLLFTPPVEAVYQNRLLLRSIFVWMTLATLLTVWGMWALRRSFSITVEARSPVTRGPYRWLRHPVYLGEMGAAAAVAFWRYSLLNLLLFLLFVVIQLSRSRLEEVKMGKFFPEYERYRQNTWWLF